MKQNVIKPSDFPRPRMGDKRRFRARTYNGGKYQVYGSGLLHICECETVEMADMVADALELVAKNERGGDDPPADPDDFSELLDALEKKLKNARK